MFASPTKWEKGWDDSHTHGDRDGSFWWPTCPLGYAAVGGVATYQPDGDPTLNEAAVVNYKCVKEECLEEGSGTVVWTDRGSHGSHDAYIYQVDDGVFLPSYLDSTDHLPFYRFKHDCI